MGWQDRDNRCAGRLTETTRRRCGGVCARCSERGSVAAVLHVLHAQCSSLYYCGRRGGRCESELLGHQSEEGDPTRRCCCWDTPAILAHHKALSAYCKDLYETGSMRALSASGVFVHCDGGFGNGGRGRTDAAVFGKQQSTAVGVAANTRAHPARCPAPCQCVASLLTSVILSQKIPRAGAY